jgi:hypothetical protein
MRFTAFPPPPPQPITLIDASFTASARTETGNAERPTRRRATAGQRGREARGTTERRDESAAGAVADPPSANERDIVGRARRTTR